MSKIVTSIAATAALAILFASVVAANVLANSSNSTSPNAKSNHVKYCEKLKDKKTRSIICPDIFSKKETTVNLYG